MENFCSAGNLRSHAEERGRRLKYSISSSLLSKTGTAAVQLLALPIAIRALGVERFSIYVVLTSAVSWIGIANLGVGPYLAIRLAAAASLDDRETQKRLLASAFFPIGIAAGALCAAVLLSQMTGVFARFTPAAASAPGGGFGTAALILAALVIAQVLIGVFEAAQMGYQEQYFANLFSAAGNVCCFVALIYVSRFSPSVLGMVLAVNAPLVIGKGANVIHFLCGRSYLLPSFGSFSWPTSRELIAGGFAVSLVGIGSFLSNQYPVIMAGRFCEPQTTATIAASLNMFILLMGIVSMTAAPLSPAISESAERGDMAWIRATYRRVVSVWVLGALPIACAVAFAGRKAMLLWFGGNVTPSDALMQSLALYFAIAAWEHVHYHFLLGLKRVWLPAILFFTRSVTGVILARGLLRQWGGPGLFLTLAGAVILFTALPFGYYCRRSMQRLTAKEESNGASFAISSPAV